MRRVGGTFSILGGEVCAYLCWLNRMAKKAAGSC